MLQITVPGRELFDEEHGQFLVVREQTLQLEHSLVSLSNGNQNGVSVSFLKKIRHEMRPLII